ncbi:MAG: NAD(P)/FAD-dependent oxidoreductase, partial [Deinococcus sp.]|nr:NAD(P)/FAD-dependent oxidoreductase [Deinococcus sp.]
DWGINLPDRTKSCTIVHRREEFRASEGNMARLAATKTRILVPYEVKELRGDSWVKEVVVYHNKTKAEEVLPADAVLMMLGFLAKLGPIAEWGLELEKNQVKVNSMMETNLPGVFACGDIVTYPGKLKLIATGFGEAAIAANMARAYTDPSAGFEPGHSSAKPR